MIIKFEAQQINHMRMFIERSGLEKNLLVFLSKYQNEIKSDLRTLSFISEKSILPVGMQFLINMQLQPMFWYGISINFILNYLLLCDAIPKFVQ